jgi:hypothetical protein
MRAGVNHTPWPATIRPALASIAPHRPSPVASHSPIRTP